MLRTGGKTAGYYRMTEASVGLLAGAQSQAVFILFMNEEALKRFLASNGWTVGADANVSMINVGANATLNTTTTRQEVIGFVMTNGGASRTCGSTAQVNSAPNRKICAE